ncbi:hypothetical protein C7476_106191 [Phyllobacterium bourgognense]|uniref:Uncharacterized protein n=1 Tax=Phyllobacterium bourgognense TaxID=314236 RepID=A0A368YW17_9HYPH|nr:hypothetical protein C7476_106191 [Phyllobacterium bourgognense]
MRNRISAAIVAVATVVGFVPQAGAGSGSGLVRNILVTPKGIVTFTVDVRNGAPACSTIKNDFAFDGSTSEGKAKLALLIAAANGKKAVSITGDGTCSAWPDRETPLWISAFF